MTTPTPLQLSTNQCHVDVTRMHVAANSGNDDAPTMGVVMFATWVLGADKVTLEHETPV